MTLLVQEMHFLSSGGEKGLGAEVTLCTSLLLLYSVFIPFLQSTEIRQGTAMKKADENCLHCPFRLALFLSR